MESSVCTLCKSHGHTAERCPELRDPLRNGFYSGGGGGGGGGGDDDEHYRKLYQDDRQRRFFVHVDFYSVPDSCSVHSNVLQGFKVPCISNKIRC